MKAKPAITIAEIDQHVAWLNQVPDDQLLSRLHEVDRKVRRDKLLKRVASAMVVLSFGSGITLLVRHNNAVIQTQIDTGERVVTQLELLSRQRGLPIAEVGTDQDVDSYPKIIFRGNEYDLEAHTGYVALRLPRCVVENVLVTYATSDVIANVSAIKSYTAQTNSGQFISFGDYTNLSAQSSGNPCKTLQAAIP